MITSSVYDPIQAAFENAVRDFENDINDDDIYQQILKVKTAEDVYDATDKLQKDQAERGHLRHLAKIQPFLENLRGYAAVIEVFLQAKPDILALIWGPIKLVLEWTSSLKRSFDAIINTTQNIGLLLPEFKEMAKLFQDNAQIKDVLLLFFKDLLDFYSVSVKFFSMKRWKIFFESMWPRHHDKIKIIAGNIERHSMLFRNEVRLEHIQEEHQARIRALQHFEITEKAFRRQEFDRIEAKISPMTYEGKLDEFQGRTCQRTGNWLITNSIFRKWLDPADSSTNYVWLQGIPGAGKTFLSSFIVSQTKSLGPTAYVFLSYTQSDTLSALTVLQSFIFQLASSQPDLQETISHTDYDSLKSNIDTATDLLLALLNSTGTVYIVIDGLDEMEAFERIRLLLKIAYIMDNRKHLKVLVSSRIEHDISTRLKDKPTIRVDEHNVASIEIFVAERTKAWFEQAEFSPAVQAEIRDLLVSVPSKAQGMFLYAKVVLDNVSELDSVDEITSELRALPKDLNEAYRRILDKINTLKPPILREKAQRLVCWIASAPMPMTVQEMEQLLCITRNGSQTESIGQGVLNIPRICGPILEVVDEYVQFVHFTVREYFFSPQIDGYINLTEATLQLTIGCLTHLSQRAYEVGRSDEEIATDIKLGVYGLHNFASLAWSRLVDKLLATYSTGSPPTALIDKLEQFMNRTAIAKEVSGSPSIFLARSAILKPISSTLHHFVNETFRFRDACSRSEFRMDQASRWAHLDPTTISSISARIYELSDEAFICRAATHDDCTCVSIRRYGFEDEAARAVHMKTHTKVWTCNIPECKFSIRGFPSEKLRDRHQNTAHRTEVTLVEQHPESQSLDQDDIFSVLIDLISLDKIEAIKAIFRQPDHLSLLHSLIQEEDSKRTAIFTAAQSTLIIDELSLNFGDPDNLLLSKMIDNAVKSRNVDILQHLLQLWPLEAVSQKIGSAEVIGKTIAVLVSDCDEAWHVWVEHCLKKPLVSIFVCADWRFWSYIHKSASRNIHRQQLLSALFKEVFPIRNLKSDDGSRLLSAFAQSGTCSEIVRYLLNNGVDARKPSMHGKLSPLEYAVRRSSREAAEITKLLLYHGANPVKEGTHSAIEMRDEKGARDIKKWLGISWDELVEETQGHWKIQQSKQDFDFDAYLEEMHDEVSDFDELVDMADFGMNSID